MGAGLGQITMYDNVTTVDAIVVHAGYIKRRGANYTVSLLGNPIATDRNTLQVLNTLPGLNGLSINGKGSSLLYVNGREMRLPPEKQLQYLASLRAYEVESISISPSGGAKYSAGHKEGVIRIQLRKDDERRFSGSTMVPLEVKTETGDISTDIPLILNYSSPKFASYTFLNGHYIQNEPTYSEYSLMIRPKCQIALEHFMP